MERVCGWSMEKWHEIATSKYPRTNVASHTVNSTDLSRYVWESKMYFQLLNYEAPRGSRNLFETFVALVIELQFEIIGFWGRKKNRISWTTDIIHH